MGGNGYGKGGQQWGKQQWSGKAQPQYRPQPYGTPASPMSSLAGNFNSMMQELGALGEMSRLGTLLATHQSSAGTGGSADNSGNGEQLLKKLEGIIAKASSADGRTSQPIAPELGRPDVSLPVRQADVPFLSKGPLDQASFDRMLSQNTDFTNMKNDVGKVQSTVAALDSQLTSIKQAQSSGFSRLENLVSSLIPGSPLDRGAPSEAVPSTTVLPTAETAAGFAHEEPLSLSVTGQITLQQHERIIALLGLSPRLASVKSAFNPADGEKTVQEWWVCLYKAKRTHEGWTSTLIQLGLDPSIANAATSKEVVLAHILDLIEQKTSGETAPTSGGR